MLFVSQPENSVTDSNKALRSNRLGQQKGRYLERGDALFLLGCFPVIDNRQQIKLTATKQLCKLIDGG